MKIATQPAAGEKSPSWISVFKDYRTAKCAKNN